MNKQPIGTLIELDDLTAVVKIAANKWELFDQYYMTIFYTGTYRECMDQWMIGND